VESLGTDLGVGIGFAADKFGIIAVIVECLGEGYGGEACALVVVGDDLCFGNAAGGDFAVDEEDGDAGLSGSADGGDGGVGAGVI